MQPRPSFDRATLILLAIGAASILGTAWILLRSDLVRSRIFPTATPSAFSSPETATPPPSPAPPPTSTGTGPDTDPGPPPETPPPTSTQVTKSLPAPSATYTPDQLQLLRVGTYDDTDPNIAYDRFWTLLKNPGTANAYKGTIHVSTGIGNEASFRFTGERFCLGYQRGKNFGIVRVMIDDQPHSFHEQAFDLVWCAPGLSPGDHFVRIIHDSGESINLDYIEIRK